MRRLTILLTTVFMLGAAAVPALAYEYRSTNEQNCADDNACVTVESTGPGEVALRFDNPDSYAVCFEYRTDGDRSQALDMDNFNPAIDDLYPWLCTGGSFESTVDRTFEADEYVEIRSTFGAESDQYFDWTRFDVGDPDPASKDDCRNGGWEQFDFRNQGQCIRFVTTGKDSR